MNVARDVVHVELFEPDAVVGDWLSLVKCAIFDEDAAAADQLFPPAAAVAAWASAKLIGCWKMTSERTGLQSCVSPVTFTPSSKWAFSPSNVMPFCQLIFTVPGMIERAIFQIAIEQLVHLAGAFHREQIRAAIDGDVWPCEAHAAAFHVRWLADNRNFRLRRIRLGGMQPLAGYNERLIARLRGHGLLQPNAVDDRDLGQFAAPDRSVGGCSARHA